MAVLRWSATGKRSLASRGVGNILLGKDPAPFLFLWVNFKYRKGYITNVSGDLVPMNEKQDITVELRQSVGGGKFFGNFTFKGKNGYLEVRKWGAATHEIAGDKAVQTEMGAARRQLKGVNKMIVEKESYANRGMQRKQFFEDLQESGGWEDPAEGQRIKDLYDRKAELEAKLNPHDEVFDNFIRVPFQLPDGRPSWSTLRMRSYVDGDPLFAEGGHLVGMLSVAGTFFRIFFSLTRPEGGRGPKIW